VRSGMIIIISVVFVEFINCSGVRKSRNGFGFLKSAGIESSNNFLAKLKTTSLYSSVIYANYGIKCNYSLSNLVHCTNKYVVHLIAIVVLVPLEAYLLIIPIHVHVR
jgi:hypothetical protein